MSNTATSTTDSDSEGEAEILEGYEPNAISPEDEMKQLEAELAALEMEESRIKQEEERLKVTTFALAKPGSSPPSSSFVKPNATPAPQPQPQPQPIGQLSKDLKALINDSEFSDIALCAEGRSVKCHRAILAARSPYFRKTFETNKAAKELKLPNIKYPVLMGLVEYIYTDQTTIHADWAEELGITALQYEMPQLVEYCEQLLSQNGRRASLTSQRPPSLDGVSLEGIETEKMKELRKKVAVELLESERVYVKNLLFIFNDFVAPLKKAALDGGKAVVLTEQQLHDVFSYWEVILRCHQKLLQSLEDRMKIWDQKPELGDIFLEKTAFIKLYKHYVNNFDKSIVSYKQLGETNPKWKEFLGLNLQAFLIMPVQRIPRYVLLLQDILKNTVSVHPDYRHLQQGLNNMKELTDYINANKNDADEINKILQLQNRIVNWNPGQQLVKPRRRLLREGVLVKDGRKMSVFLFTDALLYCKPKGKDKLKYKGLIMLTTATLNLAPATNDKYHFELIAQTGKLYFSATSPEEKESWHKALTDTIDKAHKELLNTAFSGFEKVESEGSKQFQKLLEEENMRKRSELALSILKGERDYVKSLETLVQGFYTPVTQAAQSNYSLLSNEDILSMFLNIFQIYKSHSKFVVNLENRVNSWVESSKLSDLFLEQFVDCFKLYTTYLNEHPKSLETIEKNANNFHWNTFLIQKEQELKVNFVELLKEPIKRLPNYYLLLEEFKRYTAEGHPDHDTLNVCITRVHEYLEQHQEKVLMKKSNSLTSSGKKMARKSSSPSLPVTKKTDPARRTASGDYTQLARSNSMMPSKKFG